MTKKTIFALFLIFAISAISAISGLVPEAWATGPRNVTSSGVPVKWNPLPITVNLETDMDVRGKDVLPLVQDALNTWENLTESSVTFTQGTLGTAVDNSNVCCFFYDPSACPSGPTDDGTNPLVIDEDGSITASFFGAGNKLTTLGFASIITFNSSTGAAAKGEAVFNAACLAGKELAGCSTATTGGLSFSDDDFESFIVHEMGHFQGLDHSQVNLLEATDASPLNDDLINTMFPTFILGNGANFRVPHRDDRISLAQLYPASDFASTTWKIDGTVFRPGGATQLQCANLVARNTVNPRVDAISALSGDFAPAGSAVGTYEILGLTPGQSYTVEVEPIGHGFTGASGYTPCRGSSGEPVPPQFDPQAPATTYTHAGGGTESGVNFTLTGISALTLEGDPAGLISGDAEDPSVDEGAIQEDIAALELKYASAAPACSSGTGTSGSGSSGSSGGCSLIRDR